MTVGVVFLLQTLEKIFVPQVLIVTKLAKLPSSLELALRLLLNLTLEITLALFSISVQRKKIRRRDIEVRYETPPLLANNCYIFHPLLHLEHLVTVVCKTNQCDQSNPFF